MKNLAKLKRHRVAPNHLRPGDVLLTVPTNPTVLKVDVQDGKVRLTVDRAPDGVTVNGDLIWVGR